MHDLNNLVDAIDHADGVELTICQGRGRREQQQQQQRPHAESVHGAVDGAQRVLSPARPADLVFHLHSSHRVPQFVRLVISDNTLDGTTVWRDRALTKHKRRDSSSCFPYFYVQVDVYTGIRMNIQVPLSHTHTPDKHTRAHTHARQLFVRGSVRSLTKRRRHSSRRANIGRENVPPKNRTRTLPLSITPLESPKSC